MKVSRAGLIVAMAASAAAVPGLAPASPTASASSVLHQPGTAAAGFAMVRKAVPWLRTSPLIRGASSAVLPQYSPSDAGDFGCDAGAGGGFASLRAAAPSSSYRNAASSPTSILATESRAASHGGRASAVLEPAGQLEGHSGSDVLDLRYAADHGSIALGITARSGRTGHALWSHTFSQAGSDALLPLLAIPDDVGPNRSPGVLLIEQDVSGPSSGTVQVSVHITAIGGDGHQLWSRTLQGEVAESGAGATVTNAPVVAGVLHDRSGRGSDVLVDVVNGTESFSGRSAGQDQPEVVSLVDGSVSGRGAAIESTTSLPEVIPAPDLNADGLEDLLALDFGASHAGLVAERGDDGSVIWSSNSHVGQDATVEPIGNVSSRRVQDLVIVHQDAGRSHHSAVQLIAGPTGTPLWTAPGDCAYRIGRAGTHRRPAAGVVSFRSGIGSPSAQARITLTPRTASGRTVFRRTLSIDLHPKRPTDSGSYEFILGGFGDVQPDGSADLFASLRAQWRKQHRSRSEILSGRTWQPIAVPFGSPTAGSLVRGAGTDLVRVSRGSRFAVLSGYDGATGDELFARSIAGTGRMGRLLTEGLRVTGRRCSDVGLTASSKRRQFIGLLTGNGRRAWTVTAGPDQLTGGHVADAASRGLGCARP